MKAADRIHPVMWVPPPLLFVLTFFAGVGLQRLAPLAIHPASLVEAGRRVGIGLIVCGTLLAASSAGIFLSRRTTLVPFGTAAHLITRGPYRFTRNPMYLSLVLIYVGVAGALAQMWPLLLLPLPAILIHRIVIPFEEARLRTLFGDAFLHYCARVRRWL